MVSKNMSVEGKGGKVLTDKQKLELIKTGKITTKKKTVKGTTKKRK